MASRYTYRHPSFKYLHKYIVTIKTTELNKYNPNWLIGLTVVEKPVFHWWRFWPKKVLLFPISRQYLTSHLCWQSLWPLWQKQERPVAGLEWRMAEQWWAANMRKTGAQSAQNWKLPTHCEDATALVLEKPNSILLFLETLDPAVFGLHCLLHCT